MASPQAQAAFDALPPDQKQRVIATTAGNPNGVEDWYNNSVKAGDPNTIANSIRGQAVGQSEDFARFNDATISGWNQYLDQAATQQAGRPQYRSMRGAEGFFDKPTECPPGQSPSGPNETDPCKDTAQLLAAQGPKGGVAPPAPVTPIGPATPTAAAPAVDDQLQQRLLEMYSGGEGSFATNRAVGSDLAGGGVWWSDETGVPGVDPALAQATLTAFTPNAPSASVNSVTQPAATRDAPGTTYSDPYEAAKQGRVNSAAVSTAPQVSSTQPASSVNPTPTPTYGAEVNPLNAAIERRYRKPNEWWSGDSNRSPSLY